ncbi:MAG TPA: PEP-CTERM sorting domain-containing protein [Terriglobales bacterium]|nr:PEP-CTERM sorting domain-containing protein [Terriglobales bacterium]
MRTYLCIGLLIIGLSLSLSASVIDQQDSTANTYMAGFSQTDLAQSFTPSANTSAGAGIYLYSLEGSDGITISLWTGLPTQGGTELASATSGPVGPDQWVDVFWSPVAVTPGVTYYLVFESINNAGGIWGDLDNGYAGGMVFANPGYQPFPDFDYTFREYSAAATPEPASLSLLAAGLFGVAGLRRKLN